MNEIILKNNEKAAACHAAITEHRNAVAIHLVELAKNLREMRDFKYYENLGYDTFDEYIESNHPFKARQAYSYIKVYENLGKEFIEEHSDLGVTKLEMLTKIYRGDVEEFIEDNNVAEMSTRELKEAIEKVNALTEQVSFLTDENEKLKAEKEETELPADVIAEINELRKKCESLSAVVSDRDREVDGLAGARIEAENKLKLANAEKKRLENELKELKAKPIEVAVAEPTEEQVEALRKEITEQLQAEHEKEIAELKEAAEESSELRRKLATAQNDEVKEFKIYFEDTKSRLEHLFSVLDKIKDDETKSKMKNGLVAFLEAIREDLN